jgi:hypothetical protein
MTDRSKFEQMLEHLVNEESDKAKELFHQLVVEKSREIYETILSEDFTAEGTEEDEEMDESKEEEEDDLDEAKEEDEEDDLDENFGFAEAGDEAEHGDIGGDAGDDMVHDIDAGSDEGDEEGMGGEGDIEDRVMDLEDALDDLRAEFEALMGDEDHEPEHHDGQDDPDFGGMGGEEDMGGEEELEDSFMREYVEKVGGGSEYTKFAKGGDNGQNTKSPMAKSNNMGGTTANIVKGGEASTGGTKGGLLNPSTKEENFGNVNVPGGNAGKTAFKKKEPGHGAEKKATGDNGDRGSDSPLNGAPKRAK